MTESEWFACDDPKPMLRSLNMRRRGTNPALRPVWRGFRLFACACCRRVWDLLDTHSRARVEVMESHAYEPSRKRLLQARRAPKASDRVPTTTAAESSARQAVREAVAIKPFSATNAHCWAARAIDCLKRQSDGFTEDEGELALQAELLRDVFGNPFCLVSLDSGLLTPTVLSLAQAASDQRPLSSGELELARLMVLADSLEDAGCTDDVLLSHLRSPGPHVRGCWALDLVLGKE
jgi:hypothetical protein